MPIYEYKCENGHIFDTMQKMSDDPLTSCEVCGASVQRVFHPVAVHFKGSGFYTTDYGSKRQARELNKAAESGADKHDAEFKAKHDKKDSGSASSGSKAAEKPAA
jgi:putative FmdB family regulatory protein